MVFWVLGSVRSRNAGLFVGVGVFDLLFVSDFCCCVVEGFMCFLGGFLLVCRRESRLAGSALAAKLTRLLECLLLVVASVAVVPGVLSVLSSPCPDV